MNQLHYFVKTTLVSLILLTTFTPINTTAFIFIDDGKYKTALCNSCDDMQMQAAAVAAIPSGGNVHVIDFKGDRIKAFNTQSEPGKVTIVKASVSEEVVEAVAQLRESVQFMKNVRIGGVPLSDIKPYIHSDRDIDSAHSLAYNGYAKRHVAEALAEYLISPKPSILKTSADILGTRFVSYVTPIRHFYPIKFSDGTTYEFIVENLISSLGKITFGVEPRHGSGKDGDAKIPDSAGRDDRDDAYGGFKTSGSPASLARILSYAKKRGIGVKFEGETTASTVKVIRCVKDYKKGKITCNATK